MSRSGYSEDCENLGLWRGAVAKASEGKRGQAFFRDLVAALDAMPVKRLVEDALETAEGEVCALGALARHKGIALKPDDTYRFGVLGQAFDIARALAQETMFENDDGGSYGVRNETPEERWTRVRKWAAEQIRDTSAATTRGGGT